jgi:hypothetical protein
MDWITARGNALERGYLDLRAATSARASPHQEKNRLDDFRQCSGMTWNRGSARLADGMAVVPDRPGHSMRWDDAAVAGFRLD